MYELPFEDDYFDVAHYHVVLMHVPDTQRALQEVRRLLKLGGMIASRELIASCSFNEPKGDPPRGLELKARLLGAGFSDVRASGSSDFFGTATDVASLQLSSAAGSSRRRSSRPRRTTGWQRWSSLTGDGLKSTSGGMSAVPWVVWHSARAPASNPWCNNC